jgi:hypothetical protein
MNHASAARAAGFSRRALFEWKAADPEFAREIEDVFEVATDMLADHAMKRALSSDGHNHDGLLIFLLRMRDPERFNKKMIEARVTGDPNNPVTLQHQHQHENQGEPPRARLIIVPNNDDDDRADSALTTPDRQAAD